jgi:hypothetical protein
VKKVPTRQNHQRRARHIPLQADRALAIELAKTAHHHTLLLLFPHNRITPTVTMHIVKLKLFIITIIILTETTTTAHRPQILDLSGLGRLTQIPSQTATQLNTGQLEQHPLQPRARLEPYGRGSVYAAD